MTLTENALAGASDAITKQAVVIIHGIGEQRPMETLRSFVESVYQRDLSLTDPEKHQHDDPDLGRVNRVWIVPDQATGTVELRRIATPETLTGVRTDFFEFYWADIMQGTPVELVTSWIRGLLLRSPFRVPRRVPVWIAWILLWGFAILFVAFSIAIMQPETGLFSRLVQTIVRCLSNVRVPLSLALAAIGIAILVARAILTRPLSRIRLVLPLTLLVAAALVLFVVPTDGSANPKLWAAALSAALAALISSVIVPYVGDVVRYVRANPATVSKREEVRERGLKLLRGLHEERNREGKLVYQRIVLVAHSLGAFVAYDLLQHLWEEVGPNHKRPTEPSQAVKDALNAVDGFVRQTWSAPGEGAGPSFDLSAYRKAQAALFKALVDSEQGWRISDFITVGSPIVHSEFLIADTRLEMERSFEERLLSSSPPRPDRPKNSMLYSVGSMGPFAHFAAPFAVVRWTNIHDYHWFPLLGDIVSGPVPAAFGLGIADHQVTITRQRWPVVLRRFVTHTFYWTWQSGYDQATPPLHIMLLRTALNLRGTPVSTNGAP